MKLERLTFVHDGDSGTVGQLIHEVRGALRFGGEGSGLIELDRANTSGQPAGNGPHQPEVSVRITSVTYSALAPDVQRAIGEGQVPCILGHAGVDTVLLVPPRSIARVTGGMSDLRGKIRFGVARVGWEL